jgi:hypothetical protein
MLINKISQAMQGELRKVDGARKPGSSEPAAKAAAGDRLELSKNGAMERDIRGEMQIIAARVKAEPDIREDKVFEARVRVEHGFYNTGDFIDKLASKLATSFA